MGSTLQAVSKQNTGSAARASLSGLRALRSLRSGSLSLSTQANISSHSCVTANLSVLPQKAAAAGCSGTASLPCPSLQFTTGLVPVQARQVTSEQALTESGLHHMTLRITQQRRSEPRCSDRSAQPELLPEMAAGLPAAPEELAGSHGAA